jgi:hypothetical protein
MPSLKTQLAGKLDASSLVQTFLTNVQGSAGTLQGITDPTPAGQLASVNGDVSGLNLGSLESSVKVLAEGAASVVGSLPIAGDVVKPVTDALSALESLVANPEIGDLETKIKALVGDLSGVFEGPRDGGVLGALHAAAVALGDSPESGLIKSLVEKLTSSAGVSIPSVPIADGIQALDGAVRVVGGLMVLDSVTADIDRLTKLMAARIDPRVLDRELAALEAALSFEGGELADAMASVAAGDLPKVQRIVVAVAAAAAALNRIQDEYTAAMGLGEATLTYLDVDSLTKELDTGRTLIRTADLTPINRLSTQLAGALQPLLRHDVLEGPTHDLDALFASVEGRMTDIAGRITAIDVAQFVQPLDAGLHLLTVPVDRLKDLLDQVRVAYQGALGTVRDGVAALPVKTIADAIHALLDPISRVIETVRQLVTDVLAALQTAANTITGALGQVEGFVDDLKHSVEALFGQVKTFLDSLHLDQALGAVEENLRKLATALQQARMEPYFSTAANAIGTAADVISNVPFNLLPDSMKSDVDAAIAPIKNADAGQLETEIESLLQITPDGHFAILDDVDAAVATLQQSYDALLAEVQKHEPREALKDVDAKLKELSAKIQQLSPALTLQPVQDAIDQVKHALASLDVNAPLQPVRDAFTSIIAKVNEFKPSTLLGGIEDRIVAARTQVTSLLRLPQLEQTLDDLHTRAVTLLGLYDADFLQHRLELAVQEFIAIADGTPKLRLTGGFGAIVAGLLDGMGLRVYPFSFETVLGWIDGASAAADLNARVARSGAAVAAVRATVDSLDFQGRAAVLAARAANVRAAIGALATRLIAGSPEALALTAMEPRLDAAAVFGFLEVNRVRFAAALAAANTRLQVIAQPGFSDADVRVANLKASIAPLDPARSYVRQLLQRIGLTGFELGLAGVLRAFFTIVPPSRLVGVVRPIFDALRERAQTLVDAILTPLKDAVGRVRAALDAIDLAPLLAALDAIHAEVIAQIQLLSPDSLLGPTLAEVNALKATLEAADPLAPVLQILNGVRDTVARVLAKLSLETILATPLAIYAELLTDLSKLDIAKLIAPLRAELDDLAKQVDDGLDKTVTAFERLQAALPAGAGAA